MVRAVIEDSGRKALKSKPVIMELVGPAAAGKTTLLKELTRFSEKFIEGADISLRKVDCLPLFVSHALLLLPMLIPRPRYGRHLTWDEFKSMVYLQAWSRVLGRQGADNSAVILVDQGPVFRLATLHEFGPDVLRRRVAENWWRDRFDEWAVQLDLVIWLDAPDPILGERINTRNRWHLVKGKCESEVGEFLARYRRSYQFVLEKLAMNSGPRLLRFDTSRQSVEDIVQSVWASYDGLSSEN